MCEFRRKPRGLPGIGNRTETKRIENILRNGIRRPGDRLIYERNQTVVIAEAVELLPVDVVN